MSPAVPSPPTRDEVLATEDPSATLANVRRRTPDGRAGMGPVAHIVDERNNLLARAWDHFDARMLGSTVGAELTGLDLSRDLPQGAVEEVQKALDAYKVVFFRDQHLSAEQHLAFARRFGDLEVHPFIPSTEEQPELVRFRKGNDTAGYENSWHHDVTWRECPSRSTILRAVEVPEVGGDTLFADMCAAYDGLPPERRAEVSDLVGIHTFLRAFGRNVPEGREEEIRQRYPDVEHPAVCTHERTGRRHLYVNRIFFERFSDRSREESMELLDELCRQADYPEYQCRFRWEPGSIAFWDNRAVQHYASSDYWPDVRIMERASIVGGRPVR
ncbi:MAG: TauD/TfdA family dioxygenase [Actinomycetota bacterium]|nr:TauD/TfdA family dioxygenase [Actinomycetota bacterium]MED6327827.1 TauD/TfdA family dioxygenase [Actinomycetota bacterium]